MTHQSEQDVMICDQPLVLDKGYRIIQIHPTLKCNLTCLHCYSSSAPRLKQELDIGLLRSFLEEAREEGYNAISVSGGEPFLYSGLTELLQCAKSLDYFNSVTTNGTLFRNNEKNIQALQHIDLLAMSIDGEAKQHNYMRNSPKAFDRLLEGLELVKDHTDRYGFIHTVTPQTFGSLLWLADFADHHDAKLLQLHPLESIGRGRDIYDALALSQEELQRVYILSHYLQQKYAGRMLVELDLIHRDQILKSPQSIYAQRKAADYDHLTDCLRELILDEHGYLLPVSHGFSRAHSMGNIGQADSLKHRSQQYIADKLPRLQALFDQTYKEIVEKDEVELLNWAELIVHNSQLQAMMPS